MNKQELVAFLLENAGESIKYRLHRELERFCRLRIAKSVPKIGSQVALVEDFVSRQNILEKLSADQLSSLKKYARLEVSWRKEKQILCDLYFKFLLISYYGNV